MRTVIIVVLVCINVALLLALMLGSAHTPRAHGQVIRGGSDYIMVSGKIRTNDDAVYVIDLRTRRMAGVRYDKPNRRLIIIPGRDLGRDFRRAGAAAAVSGR